MNETASQTNIWIQLLPALINSAALMIGLIISAFWLTRRIRDYEAVISRKLKDHENALQVGLENHKAKL